MAAGEGARALTMNDTEAGAGHPAPRSGRHAGKRSEATHDRWTLGSDALTRVLSLADALSRLTLSPLTRVGMPPTLRCARCPAPASLSAHVEALTIPDHKSPLAGARAGWGCPARRAGAISSHVLLAPRTRGATRRQDPPRRFRKSASMRSRHECARLHHRALRLDRDLPISISSQHRGADGFESSQDLRRGVTEAIASAAADDGNLRTPRVEKRRR